mgnify:CR=1 FL=1
MPGLKDFTPFLAYGGKIDPLSEIRNAGIVTNGSVFWVKQTDDPDYTTFQDAVGAANVRNGLQASIDQVRSDTNDYCLVAPHTGGTILTLGTAVDINEDRVHVLGVGYKPAPMSYNGLAFQGYVAADGIDTELVNVTGAGVELGGLKFLGTSGTAAGGTITALMRIGTAASGTPHDFWMHDVHVENTSAAADDGTAFIVNIVGDVGGGIQGMRFDRCWLGNWSWAPASVIQQGGTAGPTRLRAEDCTFVIDAQATTDDFIVIGTGVTEYQVFKNCDFINVEAGTAPASALTGAILVDNPVILRNNSYYSVTQAGTDTEVYKSPAFSGTQAAVADIGISIGTAAISPV